jgi:hypothetical protein
MGMTDFLTAETAVRQLHARYADAVWRKDFVAFGDCFTEDAEWRIAGNIFRGRAHIVQTIERVMVDYKRVLMTFRAPLIAVGDGTVAARTYVTEDRAVIKARPGMSIGRYYERIVDQGDRWRFKWRLFQLLYLGPPDLSGSFFENPDYGAPPGMPELDALPVNHLA